MSISRRPVRRTRRGDFEIRLSPGERDVLRSLPGQLRELISTDDPSAYRLYPSAYPDDPDRSREYDGLVRDDLLAGHMGALQIMEQTIDADRLDEEQLTAWLGALNDLRLVLGTRLDVTEEMYERDIPADHPDAAALGLYFYLGVLEEHIVQALASGLDPAGSVGEE